MVRMVGDSKAKKVNTFRGFLVDCYVQIDAMLDGKPFILHPMEGSSVFINQPDRFEIPEDVIVVGMENAENLDVYKRQVLENARVIDKSRLKSDTVGLLSKIKITNLANKCSMNYTIVNPHEADLHSGKISIKSPIAKALLGKKAGCLLYTSRCV